MDLYQDSYGNTIRVVHPPFMIMQPCHHQPSSNITIRWFGHPHNRFFYCDHSQNLRRVFLPSSTMVHHPNIASEDDVDVSPPGPTLVKWKLPPRGWFKLNTDGASRGNPGQSSGGGVLRDDRGVLVTCFGNRYGVQDALFAELHAVFDGLQICSSMGIRSILVETDSKQVVRYVNTGRRHGASPPHELECVIECISSLLGSCNGSISFLPREGNSAADFMANETLNLGRDVKYSIDSVPKGLELTLARERHGYTYLRKPRR